MPVDVSTNNDNAAMIDKKSSSQQALELATSGDMSELRQLSRMSHLIIPNALEANSQRWCLHLAAMNGHVYICQWLLSEVNVDIDSLTNRVRIQHTTHPPFVVLHPDS